MVYNVDRKTYRFYLKIITIPKAILTAHLNICIAVPVPKEAKL